MSRPRTSVVWSCGGGTQSAAIAALIVLGELPRPDAAVISDTGREASETWRYYDKVMRPHLAAIGVELVRLPHSFEGSGWNKVDLFGGRDKKTALIPMYTTRDGGVGQTHKYCSNEWKSRPCERFYKSLGLTGGCIWVGYSIDEFERMRGYDPRAKWNHAYPLIDRRMSRADCVSLVINRMGWPHPPRSACVMCPYRSDSEWRHLKTTDPADFALALALERQVQAIDPLLYLHRSGKPLESAALGEGQGDMFASSCDSGACFT